MPGTLPGDIVVHRGSMGASLRGDRSQNIPDFTNWTHRVQVDNASVPISARDGIEGESLCAGWNNRTRGIGNFWKTMWEAVVKVAIISKADACASISSIEREP
jgi:hypothetical protein